MTIVMQQQDDKPNASLTSQIYESLRQDILRGTLPPGKKLRIEELKETYGIGASAIREGLSMLTSDLLVERIDHRGFRVAPVSRAGFDELLRTRCWLEERALRESIRRGDVKWEEEVVLVHYRLSRAERVESPDRFLASDTWEMSHKLFHQTIIGACGSALLIHFCHQMYDLNIRYRRVVGSPIENGRDISGEHDRFVEAVLAREEERAVEMLLRHYNRTADLARDRIA